MSSTQKISLRKQLSEAKKRRSIAIANGQPDVANNALGEVIRLKEALNIPVRKEEKLEYQKHTKKSEKQSKVIVQQEQIKPVEKTVENYLKLKAEGNSDKEIAKLMGYIRASSLANKKIAWKNQGLLSKESEGKNVTDQVEKAIEKEDEAFDKLATSIIENSEKFNLKEDSDEINGFKLQLSYANEEISKLQSEIEELNSFKQLVIPILKSWITKI